MRPATRHKLVASTGCAGDFIAGIKHQSMINLQQCFPFPSTLTATRRLIPDLARDKNTHRERELKLPLPPTPSGVSCPDVGQHRERPPLLGAEDLSSLFYLVFFKKAPAGINSLGYPYLSSLYGNLNGVFLFPFVLPWQGPKLDIGLPWDTHSGKSGACLLHNLLYLIPRSVANGSWALVQEFSLGPLPTVLCVSSYTAQGSLGPLRLLGPVATATSAPPIATPMLLPLEEDTAAGLSKRAIV